MEAQKKPRQTLKAGFNESRDRLVVGIAYFVISHLKHALCYLTLNLKRDYIVMN